MADFIKLPRSWLDRRITSETDYLRAVAYLATKINENGSVDFSSGDARAMFGMSPRRYRTFMQMITSDKQTDKQATNRTTNISFDCQVVISTKRQAGRQTSDKQGDKQATKIFIPPTEAEVKAYCEEKGYHFNPEQFIPYYQKQEWKQANGQPLKDWKAGCRYWETRWKEKHGEKYYYQIAGQGNGGIPQSRYAGIRDAAAAILQQPGNIDTAFYDRSGLP